MDFEAEPFRRFRIDDFRADVDIIEVEFLCVAGGKMEEDEFPLLPP